MTTGQQADPALSAAIDAWHAACHDAATIEDGMRRVVDAVRAADMPLLAKLVTDEDVRAAMSAGYGMRARGLDPDSPEARMRAALEAYGARLVARLGRTS